MTKKKENRSKEAIKENVIKNVIKNAMLKNGKMGKKWDQGKELADTYFLKGDKKNDEADDEYINEDGSDGVNDEEDISNGSDDDEFISEGGSDDVDDEEDISDGGDDDEYISEGGSDGVDDEEDISDSGDDDEDIIEDGENNGENDKNGSDRKELYVIRKTKSESKKKTLQRNIHENKKAYESESEEEDDLIENPFSNIEEVKPFNLLVKYESDETIKETKNKTSQKRIKEMNKFYEDATKEKKKAKHTIEEEIEDPGLKWVEDNWLKNVPRKELRF